MKGKRLIMAIIYEYTYMYKETGSCVQRDRELCIFIIVTVLSCNVLGKIIINSK